MKTRRMIEIARHVGAADFLNFHKGDVVYEGKVIFSDGEVPHATCTFAAAAREYVTELLAEVARLQEALEEKQ